MADVPSDDELACLAAAALVGDRSALAALALHVQELARPVIAQYLLHQADRDDVLQELAVDLERLAEQLADKSNVSPAAYIRAAARNKSIDFFRRAQRHRPVQFGLDAKPEDVAPARSEPDSVEFADTLRALRPLLSAREWEIITLLAHGYRKADIAAQLGIAPGRLSHILSDIKTKLRHLRPHDPPD